MTEVKGGRGDIAGAAKTIHLMQGFGSTEIAFNWSLNGSYHKYKPLTFLSEPHPAQLQIGDPRFEKISADEGIIILGPAKCDLETSLIKGKTGITFSGPRFAFLENAENPHDEERIYFACCTARKEKGNYKAIHSELFPSEYDPSRGIPMGLQEGTGIFIDQSRVSAPRSGATIALTIC